VREKLDLAEAKLESYDKKEKVVLFVAIVFGMLGLFYYFYVADAIKRYQDNTNQISKLERDMRKYSQKVFLYKVLSEKRKVLKAKEKIFAGKQELNDLNTKILKTNLLFLSKKDFTLFLNNLLKKSVDNNFLINDVSIDNNDTKYIGMLKCKKIVQVSGNGSFANTIKLIREIEETKMMLQIKNLNIESKDASTHVKFDINFYGIEK